MFAKSIIVLALLVIAETRIIMVQDTPIKPEGISLKITVKEDRDASGNPIASIRLYMDDEKPSRPEHDSKRVDLLNDIMSVFGDSSSDARSNDDIPRFEDRFGIGNGKCPVGSVWRGVKCYPISG